MHEAGTERNTFTGMATPVGLLASIKSNDGGAYSNRTEISKLEGSRQQIESQDVSQTATRPAQSSLEILCPKHCGEQVLQPELSQTIQFVSNMCNGLQQDLLTGSSSWSASCA